MPFGDVQDARRLAVSNLRLQDRLLRVVDTPLDPRVSSWLAAVVDRHEGPFASPEFLRAIRALSVRYVERRSELHEKNPLDSAGKRAAFAGFYAPLHFLVVRAIAQALGFGPGTFDAVLDLGCGTGVAAAALTGVGSTSRITGIDRQAWTLDEARWNWQQLGLRGRTVRGDMVRSAENLARHPIARRAATMIVLGWSVNELGASERSRVLASLMEAWRMGRAVLVIEPVSRRAVPWWDEWVASFASPETRVDDWAFPGRLPPPLDRLDEGAGFDRDALKARSLYAAVPSDRPGGA